MKKTFTIRVFLLNYSMLSPSAGRLQARPSQASRKVARQKNKWHFGGSNVIVCVGHQPSLRYEQVAERKMALQYYKNYFLSYNVFLEV